MVELAPTSRPLILASASPRRRDALERLGVRFTVEPADVDETPLPDMAAVDVAAELALRKASAIAGARDEGTVVGADTIVVLGEAPGEERLLGKPLDDDDARRILGELSGSTHRVITGVALIDAGTGRSVSAADVTRVTMRPMTAAEIDAYVASGECFDKAGAYSIQEHGDRFVTELDGAFDNVVGFPVALFQRLLGELSAGAGR